MSLVVFALSVALVQMRDPGAFPVEMLRHQNAPRLALGLQPLRWDAKLAADAQGYAEKLAGAGRFAHSHVVGQGENLWMGTQYAYTYRDMVEGWTSEGRLYRSNAFPDVSASGAWSDVGHYTQVVWRQTTAVGCGLATGHGSDVLVCRYSPAGNVLGQWAYERPRAQVASSAGGKRSLGLAGGRTAWSGRPGDRRAGGYAPDRWGPGGR